MDSTDFLYSLSLSIRPYYPSLLANLPNYIILCPHRADVNKSPVGRPTTDISICLGPKKNVTCPCFSSRHPHVLFVLLGCSFFFFFRWEVTSVIDRAILSILDIIMYKLVCTATYIYIYIYIRCYYVRFGFFV